jgi:lipoyl(octanoyl) transferase
MLLHNLHLIDYHEAWNIQQALFSESVGRKLKLRTVGNSPLPEQHLIFCEHPHVYTIGKSGKQQNLLISEERLAQLQASCYHVDRGGDITYHGPGQIVGYPIFDLEQLGLSVKEYVHLLEECIITLLASYGIASSRLAGATGVWLDAGSTRARKICAMGIRASRHITMHGFALNVNTDLNYFSYINPCGFTDKGVSSMAKELNSTQDLQKVEERLLDEITRAFGL